MTISEEKKKQVSMMMRGENHPKSKLTEESVLEIKKSNLKAKVLSEKYNVRAETIRKIKKGETWKHLC